LVTSGRETSRYEWRASNIGEILVFPVTYVPSAQDCREFGHLRYDFQKIMTKVEQIEKEVQSLAPEELAAFRSWFTEYDWKMWDRKLEHDVAAGKLDRLAAEALGEYERGETTKL
jgi:hypothetical protein